MRLAAENSERRYAHREAIALLLRALELVNRVAAEHRRGAELQILERLAGILASSAEDATRYFRLGFGFVAAGSDVGVLAKSAERLAAQCKGQFH